MIRGPLARGVLLAALVTLFLIPAVVKIPFFLPSDDSAAEHVYEIDDGYIAISGKAVHHDLYAASSNGGHGSGSGGGVGGRIAQHGKPAAVKQQALTPLRPSEGGLHDQLLLTRFVAHAPGFSVIENLYYHNGTFLVVTDEPWAVPELKYLGVMNHQNAGEQIGSSFKILAVRGPPIGRMQAHKKDVESISVANASLLTATSLELGAPMLLNNDHQFISHYYHFIGETFLGAWRIWNNYAWARGLSSLPDFKVIAFPKVFNVEETKVDHSKEGWEDHAGANRFFMETWFPKARIETAVDWHHRRDSDEVYRMPLVVISDRRGGHEGPSASFKPWGDVLRMPVQDNWLENLRDRVLKGYTGPVSLQHPDKPRLVYLSRQDTGRRLDDDQHKNLVIALEDLHDEGVIDFTLLQFVDGTPFPDQLAEFSKTDFVIAVHGNGLTHSLWMSPGQGRAVFEIQPHDCSVNDYSPLALAAGVQHFLVHETKDMCTPLECPTRGCQESEGPTRDDMRVDPALIIDKVRELVAKHYRNGRMIPDLDM